MRVRFFAAAFFTPVRKTGFDKPRNPAAPVRLAEQRLAAAEAAYKARGPSKVCFKLFPRTTE